MWVRFLSFLGMQSLHQVRTSVFFLLRHFLAWYKSARILLWPAVRGVLQGLDLGTDWFRGGVGVILAPTHTYTKVPKILFCVVSW